MLAGKVVTAGIALINKAIGLIDSVKNYKFSCVNNTNGIKQPIVEAVNEKRNTKLVNKCVNSKEFVKVKNNKPSTFQEKIRINTTNSNPFKPLFSKVKKVENNTNSRVNKVEKSMVEENKENKK